MLLRSRRHALAPITRGGAHPSSLSGLIVLLGVAACSCKGPASSEPERTAFGWVERFGDARSPQASGVGLDPSGNVVVTGTFGGALQIGATTLTAPPLGSLFVAKLDPAGHALWSAPWTAAPTSQGDAVVVDHAGNVLLVGRTDAAPASSTTLVNSFFLAKLDPTGKTLWNNPLPSAYAPFNLTVTGGGFAILSAHASNGLYVEMVDPTGVECWDLTFGESCTSGMAGVAANASSALAITGFYDCPVDFGGGPLVANGSDSLFVATYTANGEYAWSRGFGAPEGVVAGRGLAMNDAGEVFVAGNYSGSPDLGGGPLPQSAGGLFVLKLDASGNHVWSRGYDGAATAAGRSLVLGASGQVFVMGTGTAPGELGSAPATQSTFVLALTAAGASGAVNRFVPQGASSSLAGAGLAAGAAGPIAFVGVLSGTVDFGQTSLVSTGPLDVVVGVMAP